MKELRDIFKTLYWPHYNWVLKSLSKPFSFLFFISITDQKMEYYHGSFKILDPQINNNFGQSNAYQLKDLQEATENLVSQVNFFLSQNNVSGRDFVDHFSISKNMIFRPPTLESSCRLLGRIPDLLNQSLMRWVGGERGVRESAYLTNG